MSVSVRKNEFISEDYHKNTNYEVIDFFSLLLLLKAKKFCHVLPLSSTYIASHYHYIVKAYLHEKEKEI